MEQDYVTILSTTHPHKFLVAHMKYRASDDEYVMARVSKAMKHEAATRLAHDWAIVLKLEVKI